jgi:hypothetical protein
MGKGFSNLREYGEYVISVARFVDSYTYNFKNKCRNQLYLEKNNLFL